MNQEDPELSGANSLLCSIRNSKENRPEDPELPGGEFLIILNKKPYNYPEQSDKVCKERCIGARTSARMSARISEHTAP